MTAWARTGSNAVRVSWLLTYFLMLCGVVAVSAATSSPAWNLNLGDPDNLLRFVQIRDWLNGQSWWDVTQYRINPPHGLRSHWSRIADLPVGVTIALLKPMLGQALAERIAVVGVPVGLLGAAIALIAQIGRALTGFCAIVPALFLVTMAPALLTRFTPGCIDHHGLQIVMLLATIASLLSVPTARNGWIAAFATATSVAIGLETAPYLAAISIWVALIWTIRGIAFGSTATAFFAGVATFVPLLFVVTTPVHLWPAPIGDALGRGHVAAAAAFGSSLALACGLAPISWPVTKRAVLLATIVAGVGLTTAAAFPEIFAHPYSNIDPTLERLWTDNIIETRSIGAMWARQPLVTVTLMTACAAVIVAAISVAALSAGTRRDHYVLLAILVIVGAALTVMQVRSVSIATSIVLLVVIDPITRMWQRTRDKASLPTTTIAVFGLIAALVCMLLSVGQQPTFDPSLAFGRSGPNPSSQCASRSELQRLNDRISGLALSPIDISAPLLAHTDVRVITAPQHRNDAPNLFAYRAMLADPASARRMLHAYNIDYLIFCIGADETTNLVRASPSGLIALLTKGSHFAWLSPVEIPAPTLRVFAVSRRPPIAAD